MVNKHILLPRTPPFYRQDNPSTCSLAVLRMVLAHSGVVLSENELLGRVIPDYGEKFSNIWNPTIAKLACEYGLETTMYARWPLFKPELIARAIKEFEQNPDSIDIAAYESPNDADVMPEPLPLAYREMFSAIQCGCKTVYGGLTFGRLKRFLGSGCLIQTSIRLQELYPGRKKGFHSILLYKIEDGLVEYHDPYDGASLTCSADLLVKATSDVGAFVVFN